METKYAEKRVVVQDVNRRIWISGLLSESVGQPPPTQVTKDNIIGK